MNLKNLALSCLISTGLGAVTHAVAREGHANCQIGLASWYGPVSQGRRTASGERLDTRSLTAAHRFWPFGTRVRVTNRRTGRSIVVRINDRGPFVRGRVIDLAPASAHAIGLGGVDRVILARLSRFFAATLAEPA